MSFSSKVSQSLQCLHAIDPEQHSVTRNGDQITQCSKRSALANFFSWVIYLVTFTLVPRNRELDQITQEILIDLQDIWGTISAQEKDLAEKAIRNLGAVVKNNGGCKEKDIAQMLATIEKIQGLPEVQKLSPKPEPKLDRAKESSTPKSKQSEKEKPDAPVDSPKMEETEGAKEVVVSKQDNTLQVLLQTLLQQEVSEYQAAELIAQLLPSIEDSISLSEDELVFLGNALPRIKSELLVKHLSPSLLRTLVKNSLMVSNLTCVSALLEVMKREAFDQYQLQAFVQSFASDDNLVIPGVLMKEIPSNQLSDLFKGLMSVQESNSFMKHLTDDEIKQLILHVVGLIVRQCTDDSTEKKNLLGNSLFFFPYFFGKFGRDDIMEDRDYLELLCQVKSATLLAIVVNYMPKKAFVLETILKANPPDPKDSSDVFFQQFVDALSISSYSEVAKYVFAHLSERRQQILSDLTASLLADIPSKKLAFRDDQTALIKTIQEIRAKPNDRVHQKLSKTLSVDRLSAWASDTWLRDLCSQLLPLADVATQVQFVSKAIQTNADDLRECLEKAQLKLTVWEEASKQVPGNNFLFFNESHFPSSVLASIVNGQVGNHKFLTDFFRRFFDAKDKLDTHVEWLDHLKPEVFEFDQPEGIAHSIWYRFFKALRKMSDQDKAKTLLTRATLNLLNSPKFYFVQRECIYAMKCDQLEQLPLTQYTKPEIRLLLACLTGRLDDSMIDTANSLFDEHGGDFFNFFEEAYQRHGHETDAQLEDIYCFAFKKDSHYLNEFLTWLLDRPSMVAVLPTWTWINDYHARDVLLRSDIEKDQAIQGWIKGHGLRVNKPKGLVE